MITIISVPADDVLFAEKTGLNLLNEKPVEKLFESNNFRETNFRLSLNTFRGFVDERFRLKKNKTGKYRMLFGLNGAQPAPTVT